MVRPSRQVYHLNSDDPGECCIDVFGGGKRFERTNLRIVSNNDTIWDKADWRNVVPYPLCQDINFSIGSRAFRLEEDVTLQKECPCVCLVFAQSILARPLTISSHSNRLLDLTSETTIEQPLSILVGHIAVQPGISLQTSDLTIDKDFPYLLFQGPPWLQD